MKLNTYKNYHICPICNRELPYTRTYFKRKIIHGKEYLHEICKECSDKERYNKEYSNGLLFVINVINIKILMSSLLEVLVVL